MKQLLRLTLLALVAMVCNTAMADEATFTKDQFSGQGSQGGKTDGTSTITATVGDIKISEFNGYSNPSNAYFQLYAQSGLLTISPLNGVTITDVVITANKTDYNGYQSSGVVEANVGTLTGSTTSKEIVWTGTSTSDITISHNKQMRVDKIVVTYSPAGAVVVKVPTISGETIFDNETEVTIAAEDGASIYYTTDNTDPTTGSTPYTGAFKVSATTTVKAIAVVSGNASSVSSKTFTKAETMTLAQAQAAEVGTVCSVQGIVVAKCTKGVLLADNTGYLYYYLNSLPEFDINDNLKVMGSLSTYGGLNQLTNSAVATKVGSNSFEPGQAEVMDGAAVDAWVANPSIKYVQLSGTLNISGSYYNLAIENATTVGSILYPTDDIKSLLETGNSYKVNGYLVYPSGSAKKYANIIVTSVTSATGINGVVADEVNADAPVYNLAGQRVNKNVKGILIKNGKAFINK